MTLDYRSRNIPRPPNKWSPGVFKIRAYEKGSSLPSWTEHPYEGGELVDLSAQITGSESHKLGRSGHYEAGGPFYTTRYGTRYGINRPSFEKTEFEDSFFHRKHITEEQNVGDGIALFDIEARKHIMDDFIEEISHDFSDLDTYGTEAISICSPANPASEVGTGVSELYREGLPVLPGIRTWQNRTNLARAAGDEYLNYQFGWAPLVSEVKKFASVVGKKRQILEQYHRDSGKNVRRQFYFPVVYETPVSEQSFTSGYPYIGNVGLGSGSFARRSGTIFKTSGVRIKRWFSGSFTFTVPSQSDSWQRLLGYGSDADLLYGASLNPELLWNLSPWSWAVDWFTDAGDVINNISNYIRAGQVMRYGYIMEETESFHRYFYKPGGYPGFNPLPIEHFRVTKRRAEADPFGFGITASDWSPTQFAIAAALGLSVLL